MIKQLNMRRGVSSEVVIFFCGQWRELLHRASIEASTFHRRFSVENVLASETVSFHKNWNESTVLSINNGNVSFL